MKTEGIEITGKDGLVPWDKIGMKDYYRYFALYHVDNPVVHARFSYNEYGTETLWSVVRTILQNTKAAR